MPRKKKETPDPENLPTPPAPKKLRKVDQVMQDLTKAIELPELPAAPSVRKPVESAYRPTVKVRPTPLAYTPRDRSRFCHCEYDLSEIARALDTECLLQQSISKHHNLCMKEGWTLTGKNPDTITYIQRRLLEFEIATTISPHQIVRDIVANLILYSNAFLVFRRDPELSTGSPVKKFDKDLDPIAGMFVLDPTSMRIRRNRWGEVKRYYQVIEGGDEIGGSEKYFDPEDVIHFYYNRKTGLAWGTPFVVPVLDDIRTLRSLEEIAHMICHKGAFPLIQYKVGTEAMPCIDYEDGTSEVTIVEEQVQLKTTEGMFVTPERHEITSVDGEAPIRDISKYIEHFKMRALAGLNLSGIDIGEGDTANRGTATQMSKSLQYRCKDFQKVVAMHFTSFFDDLLAEGGFPITYENRVEMTFPEIDIETQQLVQNHALVLYQGQAIDEDELRRALGREPFTDDQHDRRHVAMVMMPELEMKRQAEMAVASEKAKATTGTAASKNKPSNQSGKKASAGSRKNDAEFVEQVVGFVFDDAVDLFREVLPKERSLAISCLVDEIISQLETEFGDKIRGQRAALINKTQRLYSLSATSAHILLPICCDVVRRYLVDVLISDTDVPELC